jgi:hypothetical protein
MIITCNKDGTFYADPISHTNQHPFFDPGVHLQEHGVWSRDGQDVVGKGFWYAHDDTDPPGAVKLGRSIAELTFLDPETISGLVSFDSVPCEFGVVGEPVCPDPTEMPFLELGVPGDGKTFPVVLKRFR